MSPIVEAGHAGRCANCGKPFEVGDQIQFFKFAESGHAEGWEGVACCGALHR